MEEMKMRVEFLKALNKAQGLMEPVKKDSENPHFKSRYASLAAVNEAIMGPLSEAGFVIMQGGADIGGKPYLRTTLAHVGGHWESFDYPIILGDSNPQHLASAVTYARRYAICALLNLSTEDDDGNAAAKTPVKTAERTYEPVKESSEAVASFIPQVVSQKDTAKGKPYLSIKDNEGNWYNCFDEAVFPIIHAAKASQNRIKAALKIEGKFKNIQKAIPDGPEVGF